MKGDVKVNYNEPEAGGCLAARFCFGAVVSRQAAGAVTAV